MRKINANSVSLAGEFAVLSQLSLRGFDANMTLGRTKGVDILVSNPRNGKLFQLEVKTNFRTSHSKPSESKIFGKSVSGWMMHKKHEKDNAARLFYCFVNISKGTNSFKFYIVPSKVVSSYVKNEHKLWLRMKKKEGKLVKNTEMRIFRFGVKGEEYLIPTPPAEDYEDNWNFEGV